MELDELLGQHQPVRPGDKITTNVPCRFITGSAGTGKTTQIKKEAEGSDERGRKNALLCATTGIAGVNLGASTINSILKYFDTASMADRLGKIQGIIKSLALRTKSIAVDEISMMDSKQLDYLFNATQMVNESLPEDMRIGITLLGDFCQLPPIKAKYAFEADCWRHFEDGTEKLTKIWRQDNLDFLNAINAARAGDGKTCADILASLGVEFSQTLNNKFKGTTIIAKNDEVDAFNSCRLVDIPAKAFGLKSEYWGEEASEWRKHIPDVLRLKVGAFVMILNNDSPAFTYANGDCGTIESLDDNGTVWVTLDRNGQTVGINPIVRNCQCSEKTAKEKDLDSEELTHVFCSPKGCGHEDSCFKDAPWGTPSFNCNSGTYNVGGVRFYPLRLAWATTCHKSQGLSLDRVQIDCRNQFFGSPGIGYVALSRARTSQGLRIVGTQERFAERIKINPGVRRFV
jgi:ATP-dependent DNA helicase PIF1